MPRIPLDHPSMQPDPPSPRAERTPLDDMVDAAALEEQNILAARYNSPAPAEEQDYTGYLSQNQHLNFVQRLMEPDKHPRIDNQDGSYSTHLMSSAGVGGKEIVFPTIIQDQNGKLQKLSMDEAVQYALKHKEYIAFPTQQEAGAFASGGYKKAATKLWGNKY